MNDLEKLASVWFDIRVHGQTRVSMEYATHLMRLANYAICTSHEPARPDPRQTELKLVGGVWRPRPVTISVS